MDVPGRSGEGAAPVKTKVFLVDAASATVVWMNESAEQGAGAPAPLALEAAVPMAGMLGVAEAVARVDETGEPRHLQADIITTGRGAMATVISAYRVPGGRVLVVVENTFQMQKRR